MYKWLSNACSKIETVLLKYLGDVYDFSAYGCAVLDPRCRLANLHRFDTPRDFKEMLDIVIDTYYKAESDVVVVSSDSEGFLETQEQSERPNQSAELETYMSYPNVCWKTDVLLWWKSNESTFATLARLARDFLSCQGTSVACERLFSLAGQTIALRRASMEAETPRALVCLKSWADGGFEVFDF
ncbi:hypothetical protein GEMRC1_004714 [Eukaryota sp. GEM-RC1]